MKREGWETEVFLNENIYSIWLNKKEDIEKWFQDHFTHLFIQLNNMEITTTQRQLKTFNISRWFNPTIRASPTGFAISSYFTIPKSYFINYIISFYNTLNFPKLYYLTILLKYYFLIFLYYFFPTSFLFQIQLFQWSIFNNLRVFFFFFQFLSIYFNNLPIFFLEWTCQISMYSNLPTLKIHIHIYSIKPAKYQCKIHIHIYRCILLNINVFNLSILMIHIRTYIYWTYHFFFFFFEKESAKYQFTQTC